MWKIEFLMQSVKNRINKVMEKSYAAIVKSSESDDQETRSNGTVSLKDVIKTARIEE